MAKDTSHLDRMKKLQEEMAQLQTAAKDEVLERIQSGIAELKAMGFNYALVAKGRRSTGARQANADRPCPICKVLTTPPHDARTHRGQGKNKKAFTAAELKEHGYTRHSN